MKRALTFVIVRNAGSGKVHYLKHYHHLSNLKKAKVFMLKQKKLLDLKVFLMVKEHL